MCGINGFVLFGRQEPDQASLLIGQMNDTLAHRGPDDAGIWISQGRKAFFGHRRLSIIDLSAAGHQPMVDHEGNAIVFNGEIYNYRELRKKFGKEYKFRSDSDTEVLFEMLKKDIKGTLNAINGMFAFAFWDEKRQTLTIARDRAGKKPVYFSSANGVFSFSSEIKALLKLPWIKAEIDEKALNHFLTFNQVPEPYTMYNGIHKIGPGKYLTVSEHGIKEEEYWEIEPSNPHYRSEKEVADDIYSTLYQAVEDRMVADVPVGAFLSGGVDSSAVVAIMREISDQTIKTFSVGFENAPGYDERIYAEKVSKLFNTEHHERIIRQQDITEGLPHLIDSFDEPMADPTGIPIYYISNIARENNTIVVQSGDGADELFGGYRSWIRYSKWMPWFESYSRIPTGLKNLVSSLAGHFLSESSVAREFLSRAAAGQSFFWSGARAFKESSKNQLLHPDFLSRNNDNNSYTIIAGLNRQFDKLAQGHPHLTSVDRMGYLSFKFQIASRYLYRMDRLGMANSIEIRNPFLDRSMINLAFSLPRGLKQKNNEPKYILKKALERLLPHEILYRKKMGFSVPLKEWAEPLMLEYTLSNLPSFCKNTCIFNEKNINEMLKQYSKGNKEFTNQLWTIYFLMAWYNKWMPHS